MDLICLGSFIHLEARGGVNEVDWGFRYFSQLRASLYIRVHENLVPHPSSNISIVRDKNTELLLDIFKIGQ